MNVMPKQFHETLKPQQLAAATLLAAGMSGANAAKEIGVVPETVSRWRKDPTFSAHLNRLKLEKLDADRERLRSLRGKALDTLAKLLGSASDQTKLQAAKYILDSTLIDTKTAKEGIGSTDPGVAAIEAMLHSGGIS